jgi:hypothetical protein
MAEKELIAQPSIKGDRRGITQFHSGGPKSIRRLAQLDYDPIGELVDKYRKLEKEVERQEKIRDGLIVELTSTGKPRAYRAEIHHALYDKLIAVGDKLLRYKYGRVPETLEIKHDRPAAMVVQLTKAGETYTIGEPEMPQSIGFEGDDDED